MSRKVKPYQVLQDIRVEVFIAALIQKKSLKFDQFLVRPVGIFRRPYSKDILKIQIVEHETNSAYYEIDVSREGLYDMLPEGLFHKDSEARKKSDSKNIKINQVQRNEENAARKFFLPLEQEFFRNRIHLEITEQNVGNLTKNINTEEQGISFSNFWGFGQTFTKNQNLILLHLLPQVHKIVGNFVLTGSAMSLVLGKKVEVSIKYKPTFAHEGFSPKSLADMRLGVDSILGAQFVDGLPTILIKISLEHESEVVGLMFDGQEKKRLQCLCDYLLPVGYPVEYEIEAINAKEQLELSESKENYLGYMTTI